MAHTCTERCTERLRSTLSACLSAPHVDPVTGDALSGLEGLTRRAQLGLRHPAFLIGFNGLTLTLMLLGWREQWNYFASWLAIMVEWIVGTYMWGQTRRDAVVIREIRALAQRLARDVEQLERDVEDVVEDVVEGDDQP